MVAMYRRGLLQPQEKNNIKEKNKIIDVLSSADLVELSQEAIEDNKLLRDAMYSMCRIRYTDFFGLEGGDERKQGERRVPCTRARCRSP